MNETTTAITTRRDKMEALHNLFFGPSTNRNNTLVVQIYGMQDGYGKQGYVPPQGYDWSGVRDSSDTAVDAMYRFLVNNAATERKRAISK